MTLDFRLLTHQKEFIHSKVSTILVAGYGSGKSYTGTVKTIINKLQNPNHKVAYYLPTYPLIQDIAFDKFPEVLESIGLQYKLNKTDKEIHIQNYGTIIFRSMDKPESIIGYETAYSLIDEADILPTEKMDAVYKKILGRNRSVEGANVDVISTPEGFKWLYSQANSGHFKVIKAKTTDNKFLPQSYIDNLKEQYPPELLQAYMNGEFVNLTSGTVYSYYDRGKHDTMSVATNGDYLIIGQDFNIGGCCGVIYKQVDGYLDLCDEYSVYDTQSIITHLKDKYPDSTIEIIPDASGDSAKTNSTKTDLQLLRDAGFKVNAPSKNPRVQERVNVTQNAFYTNKVRVNHRTCPESAKGLEQQAYDKNGVPEKYGGAATIDDRNDATTYPIHRLLGVTKTSIKNISLPSA